MTHPATRFVGERAVGNQPAGVITRVIAALIDLAIVLTLHFAIYLGWAVVKLVIDPRRFSWPSAGIWVSATAAMCLFVIYLTLFWATSGRTFGGLLLGTRVVSHRYRILGWARAFARAALCVVFPVGLVLVLVDTRRRSLQDLILGTAVVYDWTTRTPDQFEARPEHETSASPLTP